MPKISTNLWFDKEAKAAAEFYLATFPEAKRVHSIQIRNTPSGTVDIEVLDIWGQELSLLNAGPYFKLNPSVSFMVACPTPEEVEALWTKLAEGGTALMELGSYPFSDKYGWIQDKYGVSWQLMFMGQRPITQKVTPTMMFVGEQAGNAEAAINFYMSVFHQGKMGDVMRYQAGEEPDKAGTIKHASFTLEGQEFAAMDSAQKHDFSFNEAISFIIHCEDQAEIDYYWDRLSADPKAEQCGWLKDKFGFSWQVEPTMLTQALLDPDQSRLDRVTQALLKMKKINVSELQAASEAK